MAAIVQIVRAATVIAGILLLDYAMLRAEVRYGPRVQGALIITALAVQVGLAGVWIAIGRDHLFARTAVLIAALGGMWAFLREWSSRSEEELSPGFWVQILVVVGALSVLRVLRFRTVRSSDAQPAPSTERLPRFTIRDTLLFTALVAVALAAVLRMQSLSADRDAPLISTVVGALLGGITLAAVAATLIARQPVWPAIVLSAGSALLGWGIGTAIRYDPMLTTIGVGLPTVVQVALLLLARGAGYRFVRTTADSVAVPALLDPLA